MYYLKAPHPSNSSLHITVILDADTSSVASLLANSIRRTARILCSYIPESFTDSGKPVSTLGAYLFTFSFKGNLRLSAVMARSLDEARSILDTIKSNGTLYVTDK